MNNIPEKDDINTSRMSSAISKHRLLAFAIGIFIILTASVVGYTNHIKAARERAELAAEQQRVVAENEREARISEQKRLQSLLDQQKREDEEKAALERAKAEKSARQKEWIARTVQCPKCQKRFTSENNKAPIIAAVSAGVAGGAAAGGAAGTYAGAGTGVAVGGVGAFPGALIGGVIGGAGGGILGGVSTAWYRDRQVRCPYCEEIFKNPKN